MKTFHISDVVAVSPTNTTTQILRTPGDYNHGTCNITLNLQRPATRDCFMGINKLYNGSTRAYRIVAVKQNDWQVTFKDIPLSPNMNITVNKGLYIDDTTLVKNAVVTGSMGNNPFLDGAFYPSCITFDNSSNESTKYEMYRFVQPTSVYGLLTFNIVSTRSVIRKTPTNIKIWLTDGGVPDTNDDRELIYNNSFTFPYFSDILRDITISQGQRVYVQVTGIKETQDNLLIHLETINANYK